VLPSETAQKMVVSRIPLPLNNVSSSGITVLYGPWFTNVPRICETPGVFHVRTGDKPGDTRGPERNRYCHSVFITLQASNRLSLSLVLTPTGQCTHQAIRVDQVLGTWTNNRLSGMVKLRSPGSLSSCRIADNPVHSRYDDCRHYKCG
jgi:hypothetical protein